MPAMTTTSNRPLSPRQARFIASLAAERVVPEMMGDAVRRADAGVLPVNAASQLIETLLAAPRAAGATRGARAVEPGFLPPSLVVPSPNEANRAGRMLNAGGIEATVTLSSGEHVTLQVRSRKPQGRGWTNCAPTDEGARITLRAFERKVGWVNVNGDQWTVTLRTRNDDVRTAVTALFEHAAGQTGGLQVREASRCGRCMRTLTDPVSIDRGIGPECFGRSTGSRAARVNPYDAAAREDAAAIIERGAARAAERSRAADAAAERAEAAHDAAFAAREREQEERAFMSDPDVQAGIAFAEAAAEVTSTPPQSLSNLAAVAASPVRSRDQQRARDLIAEALDAYCSDADRDFAMRTFDQLAAR